MFFCFNGFHQIATVLRYSAHIKPRKTIKTIKTENITHNHEKVYTGLLLIVVVYLSYVAYRKLSTADKASAIVNWCLPDVLIFQSGEPIDTKFDKQRQTWTIIFKIS